MPEKSRPGVLSSTHNRPVESLNVLDLLRVGQASEVEEQGAASACAPRMYATYEICASEALAPAARSSRAPRPRRQGAAPSAPARDVNGQENRKDQWIYGRFSFDAPEKSPTYHTSRSMPAIQHSLRHAATGREEQRENGSRL